MTEETLFQEALARSPDERTAFLEQACAGRPELLAAVQALLAAHEKPGNILDKSPCPEGQAEDSCPRQVHGPATGEFTPEAGEPSIYDATSDYRPPMGPGAVIAGRYTLVEKIGEGGMGEVWVAKQTEPVKRKVALKLIKAGMDSRAVLQRFEQERQALALMDHPHIAKVLDGGLTAERRPFFVMELVSGLPLTKFCDDAELGVRERLELFVPICQAVQHAHQKGIIHRDLKPSNILVTIIDGRGVPKIIDFGVAKATSGRLTEESLSTQFGAVLGTLEYMSPEQAGFAGEDIDTRADIYSLGVILYELLTGLRPLDAKRLRKAALTEMVRIIKEEEPSKPSTRVSTDESAPSLAVLRHTEPKKLVALLRGELDWVVMKCLEKQRDRRYETASGLARDLQRYLANEVVEARPPSASYRVRKFVSRHRGQVVAAGLVLLALLAGIGGTTWGLIRAAKANAELGAKNVELADEQAKVQARFDLAMEAVGAFHTGVSEDVLLKQDQFKDLRERLLRGAADFYVRLQRLLEGQSDVRSRRALGEAYHQLGELTGKIGSKAQALEVHRRALTFRKLLSEGGDVEASTDAVRSLLAVGKLQRETGDWSGALASLEEGRRLATGLGVSDAAPDQARSVLAEIYNQIGILLWDTGKLREALAPYEQARAIRQQLADANPAVIHFQLHLARSDNNIGLVLARTGKPEEAMTNYDQARAIRQKLVDTNPTVTEFQSDLARSLASMGQLLSETGKPKQALAPYEQARAIQQKLADINPTVTDFQDELAITLLAIGDLLGEAGKPEEALAVYEQTRTIRQKLADTNPTVTRFKGTLALSYDAIGVLLADAGKSQEALAAFEQARAIHSKLAHDNPELIGFRFELGYFLNNVGGMQTATGRPREAVATLQQARDLFQELAKTNSTSTAYQNGLAMSLTNLGSAQRRAGKPAEAVVSLRQARALWAGQPSLTLAARFDLACNQALVAQLATDPGSGLSASEGREAADRAIEALRQAIAAGYRKRGQIRTERSLDALRGREDFKKLMAELEKTAQAKPKKQQ
jgi:serine/threonine protein kinase/tetratricopeptide (TPR) repeat protein